MRNHRIRAHEERVSIAIARNVASFCGLLVAVAIAMALMGAP
jgi:hypothetical protein